MTGETMGTHSLPECTLEELARIARPFLSERIKYGETFMVFFATDSNGRTLKFTVTETRAQE